MKRQFRIFLGLVFTGVIGFWIGRLSDLSNESDRGSESRSRPAQGDIEQSAASERKGMHPPVGHVPEIKTPAPPAALNSPPLVKLPVAFLNSFANQPIDFKSYELSAAFRGIMAIDDATAATLQAEITKAIEELNLEDSRRAELTKSENGDEFFRIPAYVEGQAIKQRLRAAMTSLFQTGDWRQEALPPLIENSALFSQFGEKAKDIYVRDSLIPGAQNSMVEYRYLPENGVPGGTFSLPYLGEAAEKRFAWFRNLH